jgi:ESCRT-I complex subunit VPS37
MALRSSTASAYATAQHMKDRWAELEAQQAALYQASPLYLAYHNVAGGHLADGMCMVPQRYRPSFLHMRLRHSVSDQDNKTEALAASFIGSSDSEQVCLLRYPAMDTGSHQLTMPRSYW